MGKERKSNIELLRCILMMMIVFYHLLLHGINGTVFPFFEWQPLETSLKESFFLIFTTIAVNCYVIISGFYGISFFSEEKINWKRIIKIYEPILFYSILFGLIKFLNHEIISFDFIKCFFPFLQANYWFATSYLILCFLSPFINEIVERYSENRFFLGLLIIYPFLTFFMEGSKFSELTGFASLKLSQIFYCYIVGRVIRFYEESDLIQFLCKKKWISLLVYLFECLICFLGVYLCKLFFSRNFWMRLSCYSSPLTVLGSIAFFLFFYSIKIKTIKIINLFGSATFGVYLIHENLYFRKILYSFIQKGINFKGSIKLILFILFCTICIFLACSLIEILRLYMFSLIRKLFSVSFRSRESSSFDEKGVKNIKN